MGAYYYYYYCYYYYYYYSQCIEALQVEKLIKHIKREVNLPTFITYLLEKIRLRRRSPLLYVLFNVLTKLQSTAAGLVCFLCK